MVQMTVLDLNQPKLISCKVKMAGKLLNFHTVWGLNLLTDTEPQI